MHCFFFSFELFRPRSNRLVKSVVLGVSFDILFNSASDESELMLLSLLLRDVINRFISFRFFFILSQSSFVLSLLPFYLE